MKTEVKEALLTAAGLALELATMTKSLPYVETLSGLITRIQKIDDVSTHPPSFPAACEW